MTPNALLSALSTEIEEDPRYLTEQIVTYLGNKRSLLNFLGRGLKYVKARLGKEHLKAGDLFSGSGIVARFLKKHSEELIVNDLEEYSRPRQYLLSEQFRRSGRPGAGKALQAAAAVYGNP